MCTVLVKAKKLKGRKKKFGDKKLNWMEYFKKISKIFYTKFNIFSEISNTVIPIMFERIW